MKKLNRLAVVAIVAGLQCNLAVAADPIVQSLEAKSEILHLIRREKLDVVLPGAMRDNFVSAEHLITGRGVEYLHPPNERILEIR